MALSPWWARLYDERFEALMRQARPDAEMDSIADFVVGQLELQPGDTALEQCCGTARIGSRVAARGIRVLGVDQSASSIRAARHHAIARGLDIELTVADARHWAPAQPCDAAWNWWTAFGNGDDEAGHLAMLRRACEGLKPGGRFALDWFNLAYLCAHFAPTRATALPLGDVIEHNRLDLAAGLLRISWTLIGRDGARELRTGTIRLYLPHELARMMRQAGFEDIRALGGLDGRPLQASSARCIMVAARAREQRPKKVP